LRLHGELPAKGAQQSWNGGSDLRLGESKMADLTMSDSKMAGLRLSESKMADSPDSSVLSVSRRSLSLDGKGRGSFLKQENERKEEEGEDEEDEKEVEERLGRLLGLVNSGPPVIRYNNRTIINLHPLKMIL